MRLYLRHPYIISNDDFVDSDDLPIADIYSYLALVARRNRYISEEIGQSIVILDERKLTIRSRVFEVNFCALIENNLINPAIAGDFKDNNDFRTLSWFKTLGRLLVLRFGISIMESVVNRLFLSYYPEVIFTEEGPIELYNTIKTFLTDYWALLLFHHYLVDSNEVFGSIKYK